MVKYETVRNELVNDVSYSVDEMTVYNEHGQEVALDDIQSGQINKVVEDCGFSA